MHACMFAWWELRREKERLKLKCLFLFVFHYSLHHHLKLFDWNEFNWKLKWWEKINEEWDEDEEVENKKRDKMWNKVIIMMRWRE